MGHPGGEGGQARLPDDPSGGWTKLGALPRSDVDGSPRLAGEECLSLLVAHPWVGQGV